MRVLLPSILLITHFIRPLKAQQRCANKQPAASMKRLQNDPLPRHLIAIDSAQSECSLYLSWLGAGTGRGEIPIQISAPGGNLNCRLFDCQSSAANH